MQVVAVFVKVFDLAHFVKEVPDCNFDDFHAFREDFSEATSLGEGSCSLFLFLTLLFLTLNLGHKPLNKLDFQNDTVSIIDVGKAICTANWQSLIYSIKVIIVCRWDI